MDCAIKNVRIQPAKRHANHPPAPLEMPSPSGGEWVGFTEYPLVINIAMENDHL